MKQRFFHKNRRFLLSVLVLALALWGSWCLAGARPLAVEADSSLELSEDTPQETPQPAQKLIALTFDDGPRRSTTTKLLDGLSQRGVQATFFLIGKQVEANADVVKRMDEEGHQIGIHTFDHVMLTGLNEADFDAQVDKTRGLLKSTLGHNDFLLRPPYGMVDDGVKARADCPIILWSIDPEDWKDDNVDRIVSHIVSKAADGGIILMHDIYSSSVEAALQVVDQLHAQGYIFCTIDELFAARGIPLEDGSIYCHAYP